MKYQKIGASLFDISNCSCEVHLGGGAKFWKNEQVRAGLFEISKSLPDIELFVAQIYGMKVNVCTGLFKISNFSRNVNFGKAPTFKSQSPFISPPHYIVSSHITSPFTSISPSSIKQQFVSNGVGYIKIL